MGLGKLWAEFKAFAFQGNMIELAVAVVIGGAFGNVIHSLVGDVIMPTVAFAIHEGEVAAKTAKDATMTMANKAGLATSQPTTAPTTANSTATGNPPSAVTALTDAAAQAKVDADAAAAKANSDADAAAAKAKADAAPATPDKPISIDFKIGPVPVGKFVTELINFIILAFAVFIMIVKLLGSVMKKVEGPVVPSAPTTRECPECLSIIPIKATRCSHCTAQVPPVTPTPT